MKVCFIYEESSSIYTQNLQTFGQEWPTHTLHMASLYLVDTKNKIHTITTLHNDPFFLLLANTHYLLYDFKNKNFTNSCYTLANEK